MKQRKHHVEYSVFLRPDNPQHAPIIEFLRQAKKQRQQASVIRAAIVYHLSTILEQARSVNDASPDVF